MHFEKDWRLCLEVTIEDLKKALKFKDLGFIASKLLKMKLTKDNFIELCKVTIDMDDQASLQMLFDAYYQFWKQDVIDSLIKYMVYRKKYALYTFLDFYIDYINEQLTSKPIPKEPNDKKPSKKVFGIKKKGKSK